MADEVLTEARGKVLLITLNRPDARNAVNRALPRPWPWNAGSTAMA